MLPRRRGLDKRSVRLMDKFSKDCRTGSMSGLVEASKLLTRPKRNLGLKRVPCLV